MSVRDTRQPLVTAAKPPAPRRNRPVITFLIACTALGLSGWLVWKVNVDQGERSRSEGKRIETLETRMIGMISDQRALQDDVAARSRLLVALQSRLDTMDNALSADQRRQWQLAEVDYYVRLAEQHLMLTRDTQGAKALLDVADRILADTNDNALLKLRQAIAQDRLALAASAQVDVAGTYLRLGALDERIAGLVLPMEAGGRHEQGAIQAPPPEPALPAGGSWSQQLNGLMAQGWSKFRGLITVRHYEQPVKPLLSDAERGLIRENLRLHLGQAQLAMLRGESGVYEASLKTAQEDFSRYFQLLPAPEYNAIQQELGALAKVQVRPAVPELKASVGALDALSGRLPLQAPRATP